MVGLRVLRVATGLLLVARPEAFRFLAGAPLDQRTRRVARVLGGRDLLQAVITSDRRLVRMGAAVDALHAATMVGLAAVDARHRRPALASASVAATLAVTSLIVGEGDT